MGGQKTLQQSAPQPFPTAPHPHPVDIKPMGLSVIS